MYHLFGKVYQCRHNVRNSSVLFTFYFVSSSISVILMSVFVSFPVTLDSFFFLVRLFSFPPFFVCCRSFTLTLNAYAGDLGPSFINIGYFDDVIHTIKCIRCVGEKAIASCQKEKWKCWFHAKTYMNMIQSTSIEHFRSVWNWIHPLCMK